MMRGEQRLISNAQHIVILIKSRPIKYYLSPMKKTRSFVLLAFGIALISSCGAPIEKGKELPSTAEYVWQHVCKQTALAGQRIALAGYINLDQWRQRGDENFCQLVDEDGNHLTHLTIKRKGKNSLKIKTGKIEENNHIRYVDFDESKSFILDNEGREIPLTRKILLSFDLVYVKHADTGHYPTSEVADDGDAPFFEKFAKKGELYYTFRAENIRIDAL